METLCPDLTVWDAILEDPTDEVQSPFSVGCLNEDNAVLFEELQKQQQQRYLRLNVETEEYDGVNEIEEEYDDVHLDAFTCDHFRMYEFKVRRCARGRSHDWTECPYAHPGEKARRRDPRRFHYSGDQCPEFRKGSCKKGDTCEFAHGVFECWLHPSRYRTQPCKDGVHCRRRICFFAHTPEQLRILTPSHHVSSQPESYDGSPSRLATDSHVGKGSFGSSPTSTLYFPHCSTSAESPPMSPVSSLGPNPVNELASTIRNLQIGKSMRLSMNGSWSGYCSPRIPYTLRPGFSSLPSTPTRPGLKVFDQWDQGCTTEESVMARVESGKQLRAQIYAKLGRENALTVRVDSSGR